MQFLKDLSKQIILTLKSRDVIILLLLGPMVLTILFGGIYVSNYLDRIPIAILDEDNSKLSRMVDTQFQESDRFTVKYFAESKEQLQQLIDTRKVYMGVYIPANFSSDVSKYNSPNVSLFVDGTNLIIGNNAYAAATSIIQTVSTMAEVQVLQGKDAALPVAKDMALLFNFNDRTLYDPRMTYMNYLLLGYIAVFLQQVLLSGVGISIIKEGNEIAKHSTVRSIILKILACTFFALISVTMAVIIATVFYHVPIRGNYGIALLFGLLYAFAISCPSIIISSIVQDKLKLSQISYMLSIPTFVTCGYVWPIDQAPKALTFIIRMLWPLINFARPFDELLFKGVFPGNSMLGLLIYIAVWFPISIMFFKFRYRVNIEEADEEAVDIDTEPSDNSIITTK